MRSDVGKVDTKHPHRGFDNLWYVIEGSASTGHSTGPDGAIERARLSEERSSRSGPGEVPGTPRDRGRRDRRGPRRHRVPRRAVLGQPGPEGQAGRTQRARAAAGADPGATRRRRDRSRPCRRGFSVQLGTPALILDVELPDGGGHDAGPARLPRLRIPAGGRGCVRSQPTSSTTSPAGPAGARRSVRRHRGRPKNTVPTHGGTAVRRGTRVQRAVRGLDAKSEHRRTATCSRAQVKTNSSGTEDHSGFYDASNVQSPQYRIRGVPCWKDLLRAFTLVLIPRGQADDDTARLEMRRLPSFPVRQVAPTRCTWRSSCRPSRRRW